MDNLTCIDCDANLALGTRVSVLFRPTHSDVPLTSWYCYTCFSTRVDYGQRHNVIPWEVIRCRLSVPPAGRDGKSRSYRAKTSRRRGQSATSIYSSAGALTTRALKGFARRISAGEEEEEAPQWPAAGQSLKAKSMSLDRGFKRPEFGGIAVPSSPVMMRASPEHPAIERIKSEDDDVPSPPATPRYDGTLSSSSSSASDLLAHIRGLAIGSSKRGSIGRSMSTPALTMLEEDEEEASSSYSSGN